MSGEDAKPMLLCVAYKPGGGGKIQHRQVIKLHSVVVGFEVQHHD